MPKLTITPAMVEGLVNMPTYVLPISKSHSIDVQDIKFRVKVYFAKHYLSHTPGHGDFEIFSIRSINFRFFRTYALFYRYVPHKRMWTHFLINEHKFTFDCKLQVGLEITLP